MVRRAREAAYNLKAGIETNKVRPQAVERLLALIDRLQMPIDPSAYLRHFEDRVTDESVFCDITPSYAVLDEMGFRRIMETHDRTRFIFIMRDPVVRFISQLAMEARTNANIASPAELAGCIDNPSFALRTDYRRTITELEKATSGQNVLYLFFETLFREASIRRVTDFLGIGYREAALDQIVNPGRPMPVKEEQKRLIFMAFRPVYDFVFDRFGDDAPAQWRETYGELKD